jgi:hypothetical protein
MYNETTLKAYESDFITSAAKSLIPSTDELRLIGVEAPPYNLYGKERTFQQFSSPIFLRALKEYLTTNTISTVEDLVLRAYCEKIVKLSKTQSIGYQEIHHIVWSDVFNINSQKHQRTSSKLFPSSIGVVDFYSLGIQVGSLYLLDRQSTSDNISHRNIHKNFSQYASSYKRSELTILYLMAWFDYAANIEKLTPNEINNLLKFYNHLSQKGEAKFRNLWLSDSWENDKETLLNLAKELREEQFGKLLFANISLKDWDTHKDLPLEWLLNLYNKK